MQGLMQLPKKRLLMTENFNLIKQGLNELSLYTICQSAKCPNIYECFSKKRLTFLILGNICTRSCKFCSVLKGKPRAIDSEEPEKISKFVEEFKINYVVITSVTRDDLKDFGASHFVKVITAVKKKNPEVKIEVLIPDFSSRKELIAEIVNAEPDCIGHNLETIRRLCPVVRGGGDYYSSLNVLRIIKELNSGIPTKSALLLGLGEQEKEVLVAISDLNRVGCDILVLGQYLKPSLSAVDVKDIISEQEFDNYKDFAYRIGFKHVFAGTWMRSSNAIF